MKDTKKLITKLRDGVEPYDDGCTCASAMVAGCAGEVCDFCEAQSEAIDLMDAAAAEIEKLAAEIAELNATIDRAIEALS